MIICRYDNDTALASTEPRPYDLIYNNGDRTKLLAENPLADKTLVLFLEDVVMANEMEKACVSKDAFHGLKVYRHDAYKDTISELRKAPLPSDILRVVDMTAGAAVHFQGPKRLPEALQALGLFLAAVSDVMGPVSDTKADLSGNVQSTSSSSAAAAQSTRSTEILGDLDDSEATLHTVQSTEVPNTPGGSSTLNSLSPGQASTVAGASTGFSDLSTDVPESIAKAEKSTSIDDSAASPTRHAILNPKVIENGDSSNSLPNGKSAKPSAGSKVSDKVEAVLRTGFNTNKIDVAGVETTNSTPAAESGSIKKKKKGSKRKTVHRGKGAKNTAESSSGQGGQGSNNAIVASNPPAGTPEKLNNKALPEANSGAVESLTENGKQMPFAESYSVLIFQAPRMLGFRKTTKDGMR